MTQLSFGVQRQLEDRYGPIMVNFTVDKIPRTDMDIPESIREQWIGVPLPIRQRSLARTGLLTPAQRLRLRTENDFTTFNNGKKRSVPVRVQSVEAIDALQVAGRQEAAQYWDGLIRDLGIWTTGRLTFRSKEGIFSPLVDLSLDKERSSDD